VLVNGGDFDKTGLWMQASAPNDSHRLSSIGNFRCKPVENITRRFLADILWVVRDSPRRSLCRAKLICNVYTACSVGGFVARREWRVDWLETFDDFADGATMDLATVESFLQAIDCYVMCSKTYETQWLSGPKNIGATSPLGKVNSINLEIPQVY
jgi:hypothetical protein